MLKRFQQRFLYRAGDPKTRHVWFWNGSVFGWDPQYRLNNGSVEFYTYTADRKFSMF